MSIGNTIKQILIRCLGGKPQPQNHNTIAKTNSVPLLISATMEAPVEPVKEAFVYNPDEGIHEFTSAFFERKVEVDMKCKIEIFASTLKSMMEQLLKSLPIDDLASEMKGDFKSLLIKSEQLQRYEYKNCELQRRIRNTQNKINLLKAERFEELEELEKFQQVLKSNAVKVAHENSISEIHELIKPFAELYEKDFEDYKKSIKVKFYNFASSFYANKETIRKNTNLLLRQRTLTSYQSKNLSDVKAGAYEILDHLSIRFNILQERLNNYEDSERNILSWEASIIDPNLVIKDTLDLLEKIQDGLENLAVRKSKAFVVAQSILKNKSEKLANIAEHLGISVDSIPTRRLL